MSTKSIDETAIRRAAQTSMPATSSTTRTGVATTAWYVRSHLRPAITGKVASLAAVCIAVAGDSPGATNSR